LTEFRIFETERFQKDLEERLGSRAGKMAAKLKSHVYPQLRRQPYFGKNIRKLRSYQPETWRYRVGDFRFFYEINEEKKIVFMIAAGLRSGAYRT